jgi:hypothetical protein
LISLRSAADTNSSEICLMTSASITRKLQKSSPKQSALVKGDSYEADGKRFSIDSFVEISTIDGVRDKAAKAGCPSAAGKG